jgi:GTP cyclohydrolase III
MEEGRKTERGRWTERKGGRRDEQRISQIQTQLLFSIADTWGNKDTFCQLGNSFIQS